MTTRSRILTTSAFLLLMLILSTTIALANSTIQSSPYAWQGDTTGTPSTLLTIEAMQGNAFADDKQLLNIEDYDADYETVITEMQELEIIPIGGSLVYQTDQIVSNERATVVIGPYKPHKNVIIAGEINYTLFEGVTSGSCSFIGRVQVTQNGVSDFLNSGIGADHFVTHIGLSSTTRQPLTDARFYEDLSESHHLIVIMQDDSMTTYLDGKFVMKTTGFTERSGNYRIRAVRTNCTVNNVWVYELDTVWDGQEGVCGVTPEDYVNLRTGPGTTYGIDSQLKPNEVLSVDGQILASDEFVWWHLTNDTWVRSDIVQAIGDCETLAPEIELDKD